MLNFFAIVTGFSNHPLPNIGHSRSSATWLIRILILAVLPIIGGCGPQKVTVSPPVEEAKAMEALVTTLDAWKAGQKPEDLANHQPKISVQDLEWMSGTKLVDYKITDKVTPVDARLFVDVQLNVIAPDGKKSQKTVKYVMNTSPGLAVFRQFVD